MRNHQIETPQLYRQPKAAGSQWSIRTAAVNLKFMVEEVMDSYQRITGKPLLDDAQQQQLITNLSRGSAAPAPMATAPAPAVPDPTATAPAPAAPAPIPAEAPVEVATEAPDVESREAQKEELSTKLVERLKNLSNDEMAKLSSPGNMTPAVKALMKVKKAPSAENFNELKGILKDLMDRGGLSASFGNPEELAKVVARFNGKGASEFVRIVGNILGELFVKTPKAKEVA